ncbi:MULTISPECIES: Hpt domain-containing protein [unclassified Pseudomonas]|uniref:Hpt domain-containing protein n=1 Tax=unclassified Pseudomonas TaxID=196821 RepID=UPI000703543A|nr:MULTISPECIES: Hpt domain-containing protein [unclassified Pseudomonas]KQZ92404.1 histidine kinase [Pseudomonas sp. Root562]
MADTHLDPDALSALREVMEDGFSTLVDTFLADCEVRLQLLRQADTATQVIEAAHSFKGSSSNMGAVRLAELCGQLERMASAFPTAEIGQLITDIDGEFAIVRPLYEFERQRSPAAS